MDTECVKPLDEWVRPGDTLIAGWENEFASELGGSSSSAGQRKGHGHARLLG